MNNFLSDLMQIKVPNTLYHYTTQDGLLGIIQENLIWATHTQYLNDSNEFVYAQNLVRREIESRILSEPTDIDKKILGTFKDALSIDHQSINVCVSCFSEDGDSLSQWRGYGKSVSRFSIGFKGDFLAEKAKTEDALLVPCIYERSQQENMVKYLIDIVIKEIKSHKRLENDGLYYPAAGNLLPYLFRLAPIIKDNAFHEEREWRIITRPLSCNRQGFSYRKGDSNIVPYYKFPLHKTIQNVGRSFLTEIIVGPTPEPALSARSVESLLVSEHLLGQELLPEEQIKVKISDVPYRDW